MDGQSAEEREPGRNGDDFRWADRLEGIEKREKYVSPARPYQFAVTRLLLEAGLQLRDENLAKGEGGSTHGMGRVTREKVVRRAMKLYDQRRLSLDGRIRTLTRAFNDRWQIDRFRRDVIIFELYALRWREELESSRRRMVDLVDDLEAGRLGGADFIREVVRLDAAVRSRFLRYAVAQAGLAMEPAYRDIAIRAHVEFQAEHRDEWIHAYHLVLERCGVNLRPGTTLEKVFRWIAWLVRSGAVEASVTGSDTTDLAAEAVIAMIAGLIDPGDNRSCEAFVDDMFSTDPGHEDD